MRIRRRKCPDTKRNNGSTGPTSRRPCLQTRPAEHHHGRLGGNSQLRGLPAGKSRPRRITMRASSSLMCWKGRLSPRSPGRKRKPIEQERCFLSRRGRGRAKDSNAIAHPRVMIPIASARAVRAGPWPRELSAVTFLCRSGKLYANNLEIQRRAFRWRRSALARGVPK